MRISSFHIEGFGAFADFGADQLASGLVVVLGPNEAGKSTLFDFLTGVLFGFPARRDNPRFRAPVRGGRHGGRVAVVDDAGGRWLVERHAGAQRGLCVLRPDGQQTDEAGLRRALAGASLSLFEAVFAVGLDDLGHMRSLESDEVRELLFTASILGQRRSATSALKRLGDARDELARPRRDDARANRLAADLELLRAELASAREDARRYEALHCRAGELDAQLTAVRTNLRAARRAQHEVQLLELCWPHFRLADEARQRLAALPDLGAGGTLLEQASTIRELMSEHSGHRERQAKLEELRSSRQAIDASLARRLARLGPSWTLERALDGAADDSLGERVRARGERFDQLRLNVASAEAVLAQATLDAETLRRTDDDPARTDDEPPSDGWLTARERAVAELRDRIGEAELLAAESLAGDRAALGAARRDASRAARSAAAVLFACGLVVVAFGLALAADGRSSLGVAGITVGCVLVAVAAVQWHLSRATTADVDGATRPALAGDGARAAAWRADQLARARRRVSELADELGLGQPPSRVDVDHCASVLQRQREQRRHLDGLRAAASAAEGRRQAAAARVDAAAGAIRAEQQAHEQWCAAHGLDPAWSVAETIERLEELGEIREEEAARRRVDRALRQLQSSVASFEQRRRRLLEALAPVDAERTDTTGAAGGEAASDDDSLGRLGRLLDDATELVGRRSSLEAELATAESALTSSLGTGEVADALRARLATGNVLSWATERTALDEAVDELRASEELLVREHQSLASEMHRLATSEAIAELERRCEALEVELDSVLRRYLVLGTAHSLLRRTLARHERERQPAVVAEAAAHFARVTGGRYVGLLADSGTDGRQSIRVVSASGEVIEAHHLSRGTIEQLYLCLRLGLADSFAERSVSLPIVLDDVLVNFDPERAGAVARELVESSHSHQIVFLTCHPHLADVMMQAAGHLPTAPQLIVLGRLGQPAEQAEQLALAALTALPDPPDGGAVRTG